MLFDVVWMGVVIYVLIGLVMYNSFLYWLLYVFFIDWKCVCDCDLLVYCMLYGVYGCVVWLMVVELGFDVWFCDWCVKYGFV